MTRAPKITVYHVGPAIPPPVKPRAYRPRKRFFLPIMLLVTLLVGGIGGGLAVWESKFGQADKKAEVVLPVAPVPVAGIPLEYDQSELNVVADLLPLLIEENRHEPTAEELEQKRYEQRRTALRKYFQKRKSPFAKDDRTLDAFLQSKNMKLMIAISFVESTMGQRCYYNNCSGIGGTPPRLRKYQDFAGWIKDFDALLERRYKGLPIERFLGLYVQPGSPQWLAGVKQILAELKARGIE